MFAIATVACYCFILFLAWGSSDWVTAILLTVSVKLWKNSFEVVMSKGYYYGFITIGPRGRESLPTTTASPNPFFHLLIFFHHVT